MSKKTNLCFFFSPSFFVVWSKVFLKLVLLQQWSQFPHPSPAWSPLAVWHSVRLRKGRACERDTHTQPSLNILMPLVWTLKCEDNCNSRSDFFLLLLSCEKKTHTFLVTHLEVGDSHPALLRWARMEIAEMDYISVIAYLRLSSVHLPLECNSNCYLVDTHITNLSCTST